MKEHVMNLTPAPMQEIRTGNKTIELRLNDEKRKQISVGDTIKFINTEDSNDTLRVKVVDLFLFSSFAELYDNLPLLKTTLLRLLSHSLKICFITQVLEHLFGFFQIRKRNVEKVKYN